MLDVDEGALLLAFAVFVVLLFLIRLRNYNAFSHSWVQAKQFYYHILCLIIDESPYSNFHLSEQLRSSLSAPIETEHHQIHLPLYITIVFVCV